MTNTTNTVEIGMRIEPGRAFRQGRGLVNDEFTGVEGVVAEIDGRDVRIECASGGEIWVTTQRIANDRPMPEARK